MRSFQSLIAIATLVIAASNLTLAGEITTGVTSPPPSTQGVTACGDISTGITGQLASPTANAEIYTIAQASDSVVETVMSLVQSVLALF